MDSGWVSRYFNGKENCISLGAGHRLDPGTIQMLLAFSRSLSFSLILSRTLARSLSLSGTEPRLRDLWVVAFNPQSSLGVV